jgi:hypothetical protein
MPASGPAAAQTPLVVLILATLMVTPASGEDVRPDQLKGCWRWPRPYPKSPHLTMGGITWCFKQDGVIHGADFDGAHGIGLELTWRMNQPGKLIVEDQECIVKRRREDGVDHLELSGCPFAMEMKRSP